MKNLKLKKDKINITVFSKFDLQKNMEKLLKEQKYPMSIVFQHIAYLAKTRYFDNYPIDIVNPKSSKSSIDININVMRKLMEAYQSPETNKSKFIKEFIEELWIDKINSPKKY